MLGVQPINIGTEKINDVQQLELEKEYILQYPDSVIKLRISNNSNNNTFQFYDEMSTMIGQFSIVEVVNYVIGHDSTRTNIGTQFETKKLIEQTICKIHDIPLMFELNASSPFMNDIDILIKLNQTLQTFDEQLLPHYMSEYTDEQIKLIRKFIYAIIEHTINVIVNISHQVKNTNNDILKKKLMNYNIGLVFRLTKYTYSLLVTSERKYDELTKTLDEIKTTYQKITTFL